MGLRGVACARAEAYQALAQVLHYPDGGRLTTFPRTAARLRRRIDALAGLAQFDPARRLVSLLEAVARQDPRTVQATYVRVFGVDGAGGRPPASRTTGRALPPTFPC